MSKNLLLFFVVTLAMGILSCTQDAKVVPYDYTTVFTGEKSKTWKVKFLEQTLNGDVDDTFTVSCSTDDKYTLYANADRSLEVDMGSKKCTDDEAAHISDSWSFNNSSATLQLVLPFFTETSLPFIVREVSKNKMVLEIFFDATNTESYRIHFESVDEE